MVDVLTRKGNRKVALGWGYLVSVTGIAVLGILEADAVSLTNMAGLAALFTGMATGLGVVVWGNVQEHRCNDNGGS